MANGGPQHIGPELEAALLKRARRGAPILVQAPKRPQSEWAGFGAVSEAEHGRSGFELAEHVHDRHEKANQNSCKKSSALFKLRLGMPLNVVPVDTTVRSEHTKSMWIARGCT